MDLRINSILDNKWWQEVAILLFVFSLCCLKNDWFVFQSFETILPAISYFLILYVHAQVNRFFLLPIFLKQHKPVLYFFCTVALIFVFSGIIHEFSVNWLSQISKYKVSHQKGYTYQLASLTGTLVMILGPATMLKFYREQKRQQDEALLFNEMQLKSLRSQLNPHFLFNTFNTLYGISLQFPQRTPDLIMKMSQMLRYQIDSDSRQCVTLEEELEFINSYIQLEKERVGYRCEIVYDCKIDNENAYKMSPMLLITFIENAFKHGTGTVESCFVRISITVRDGLLHLQMKNSIPEKTNKVVSTKIGLKNTIERLNILYGDKYSLDIKEDSGAYDVDLKLQLKRIATCQPAAIA
jgi:sensor histidine kinase YesM